MTDKNDLGIFSEMLCPSMVKLMKNGKRYSKINFTFPEGTPISTPRSDIEYVATEYGCIDLKHLTMADRVRAMISLAHPDFRDELTEKARHVDLI